MSPIAASQSGRVTSSYLPFSPAIPRLSHLRQGQLSDSLAVNSPGDESLNTDLSQVLSPTQLDTSSPEDPPQTLEAESRQGYITSRGGGDMTSRHRAGHHLSRQGTASGLDGTGRPHVPDTSGCQLSCDMVLPQFSFHSYWLYMNTLCLSVMYFSSFQVIDIYTYSFILCSLNQELFWAVSGNAGLCNRP